MAMTAQTSSLPEPAHQFRMTYCHNCWHVRADHVDDGPCAFVWQWPGVGLIGCPCQHMERRPPPEKSGDLGDRRTRPGGSTYLMSMTAELKITPSTTTSIRSKGRPEGYPVVPDRLIQIDGIDYVRCHQHGLILLDHVCGDTPHDHWCREAAHPNYDPADGDQGLPNHEEQSRLSEKVRLLADALLRAALYLDGFVWVTDPEASELDDIKAAAAAGLGCKTWEQAKELADLREARRSR